MLPSVSHVINIQRRDRGLEKAPHRFAHVGGQPHQAQPPQVIGSDFAKVKREQSPFALIVELIVHRQVAKVEEAVAHAAVFPIDHAHCCAVVDEVAGQ